MCAHGHVRRSIVSSGRQAGITPNLLITHLWNIAPPPIVLHEPCPLTAAKNSMSILKELKCVLCSNILSQPLELACSSLICTKCIVDMIAASGSVNCPFCSDMMASLFHLISDQHRVLYFCCYQKVWFIVQVVVGMLKL